MKRTGSAARIAGPEQFRELPADEFRGQQYGSIAYKGKLGSFRTSVNHIYNRGQYPSLNEAQQDQLQSQRRSEIQTVFRYPAGLTYNYATYPKQLRYEGSRAVTFTTLIFQGTEYDIRDFRNYWVKPDEQQNWVVNGSC